MALRIRFKKEIFKSLKINLKCNATKKFQAYDLLWISAYLEVLIFMQFLTNFDNYISYESVKS